MLRKSVIEFELLVVNEFGHAIDLKLILMDHDLWVTKRNTVDFPSLELLLEDWPLLNANANLQLVSGNVLQASLSKCGDLLVALSPFFAALFPRDTGTQRQL